MIRVRQILFMTAAVLALLAVGCAKEENPARGWDSDPDAVRVEASVGAITRTNPLGGEESDKFSSGDRISVTNGIKTLTYKYDGNIWAPENDADYLLWDTPVTFRAWYPANASREFFYVPKVQGFGYTLANADYMASDACTYSNFGDIPKDRTFRPVLKRRMALVTVIVDKVGGQYDYLKDRYISVSIIRSGYEFIKIQSDGTFKPDGNPVSITPDYYEIDGKRAYSAIVVPGAAVPDETFLVVRIWGYEDEERQVNIDKKVYVTGIPAAEAGKHYTYKLVVGKENVKIAGVTVKDWTTGGPVEGKFGMESDEYSEWDGKSVKTYFDGDGTEASPYLITSAAELAGLAKNVSEGEQAIYSGKYFKLTTNIDLMGHEWTPIGMISKYFYGNFDGDGKVITNMTISNSMAAAGLFGYTDGTIQNIVLKNASVTASIAALLVGCAEGGAIKACKVDGSVCSPDNVAAGIVGQSRISNVEISDCEVNVDCSGSYLAGGVVGDNDFYGALVVKNCIVRGRIYGGNYIGGIAGSLQGSGVEVTGCKSYATLSQIGKNYIPTAGGIAAGTYYGCKFQDCEVYGNIDIESENDYDSPTVGGAIGLASEATISNLKFEGTMTVKRKNENNKVGAVIGVVEKSLNVSSQCIYRKSGTGEFPPVGTYPDGVDISKIKGI